MDTSDPEIVFDGAGVCNHCRAADIAVAAWQDRITSDAAANTIRRIKDGARRGQYHCIIGLSGGTDSSYLALRAIQEGLRPLAVHLDNGWDSELAVQNIENIVTKLDLDLHTHVIRWPEFRDLQLAYIKASVIDIEVPTDHAIGALVHREANRRGIRYILSGSNTATESILPRAWFHPKTDLKNLKSIHRAHGSIHLRTYPTMGPYRHAYYERLRRITTVPLLDLMPYDKHEARKSLEEQLAWSPYADKHGESAFTRFYQGYILPNKFNVDKRRAHFSSLICAGQMSRDDALLELANAPMSPEATSTEKTFVAKKLKISLEEFDAYMDALPRSHFDYGSDFRTIEKLVKIKHTFFAPRNRG